jgi:hypothetical protein
LLKPTTTLSTLHLKNNEFISQNPEVIRDMWKNKTSPHFMQLNTITNILASVLGPSWKTSLAGYAQLSVVTAYQAYETLCANHQPFNCKFMIVSIGLAVGLRFAKDEGLKLPVTITVESKGGQHVPGIEVKPAATV